MKHQEALIKDEAQKLQQGPRRDLDSHLRRTSRCLFDGTAHRGIGHALDTEEAGLRADRQIAKERAREANDGKLAPLSRAPKTEPDCYERVENTTPTSSRDSNDPRTTRRHINGSRRGSPRFRRTSMQSDGPAPRTSSPIRASYSNADEQQQYFVTRLFFHIPFTIGDARGRPRTRTHD